jgi:hypothetical protein
MDCFAEPVIGRRFAPTRWLAMTVAAELSSVSAAKIAKFFSSVRDAFAMTHPYLQLSDVKYG